MGVCTCCHTRERLRQFRKMLNIFRSILQIPTQFFSTFSSARPTKFLWNCLCKCGQEREKAENDTFENEWICWVKFSRKEWNDISLLLILCFVFTLPEGDFFWKRRLDNFCHDWQYQASPRNQSPSMLESSFLMGHWIGIVSNWKDESFCAAIIHNRGLC